MAVTKSVSAAELVRQLAELVRAEPSARYLYYRQSADVFEFWLVTEPIEIETERRVRGMRRSLIEVFPDTLFEFHLINPRLSGQPDPRVLVPEDATLVTML